MLKLTESLDISDQVSEITYKLLEVKRTLNFSSMHSNYMLPTTSYKEIIIKKYFCLN